VILYNKKSQKNSVYSIAYAVLMFRCQCLSLFCFSVLTLLWQLHQMQHIAVTFRDLRLPHLPSYHKQHSLFNDKFHRFGIATGIYIEFN